jgi:ribokinase
LTGLNQVVACARLSLPNVQPRMVGRYGNDAFGKDVVDLLQKENVDCTDVSQVEGSTGVAVILVAIFASSNQTDAIG